MAQFYGMLRLGSPEQWKGLAGEDKWVPTRSAYELAYAWHGINGIPAGIKTALDAAGVPELARLKMEIGFVEKPSFLDTPVGPSMTDIMVYARNGSGDPVILAVEGKATESFGLPVRAWVRGDLSLPAADAQPRPSRLRRLAYLAERLGLPTDADSPLYYQLLHRTVSAITEATLAGAECAVLIIHSFASQDDLNWTAFVAFMEALGVKAPQKGKVSGPVFVPGAAALRLYALWYADAPRPTPV